MKASDLGTEHWLSAAGDLVAARPGLAFATTDLALRAVTLVDQGIELVRQAAPVSNSDLHERHRLIETLARLQLATLQLIDELIQNSDEDARAAFEKELARHVDDALRRDDAYLSQLLSLPTIATGVGLAMLDSFHGDLQWYDSLASRLEDEAEPDRAYAIKSRLDHLSASLEVRPSDTRDQPDDPRFALQTQRECRRLEQDYLDRRIRDELAFSIQNATPLSLWNRRFQLSRLEADRMAMAWKPGAAVRSSASPQKDALTDLDRRQAELADHAETSLCEADDVTRRSWTEGLVVAAQEESNDLLTLVDDVPLPVAVELLRSNASDFRRLTGLFRHVARKRPAPYLDRAVGAMRRLSRRSKNELQEKKLSLRLERIFGKRWVGRFENLILVLILALTGLIVTEMVLAARGTLTPAMQAFFAWADLAICSVFLTEFTVKILLAPDRLRYLRRHFVVDLLASIPFGFITYWVGYVETLADEASLLRLFRFLRLPQLARYLRVAQPIVRVGRLVFFLLRTTDRLVRRNAAIFNRNVVLFEPDAVGREEPSYRLRLTRLREHYSMHIREIEATVPLHERIARASLSIDELRVRLEGLPTTAVAEPVRQATVHRDLYAEEVVRELVEMTPERLVQRLGPRFPESIARYVRFFDLPVVRRLPIISELVASRHQGAGPVAALAVNYAGYILRSILEAGYFLADLHGTISGPIFLDRFGTLLVKATARNAYRLVIFGIGVIVLSGLAWLLKIVLLESLARKLRAIFVLPVVILGAVCLLLLVVGRWLKWLANQTSEQGERLVEAQFAAQTKLLKQSFSSVDLEFLAERVVLPELVLRQMDDASPAVTAPTLAGAQDELARAARLASPLLAHEEALPAGLSEEMLFLRGVVLLHQDYLDSGIFRLSDTKMTTQLLGNLALANLRQSSQMQAGRQRRQFRALDPAAISGGLFGGPYLWFHYMTRIITEETAKLLRDYNRNAVPLCRLPSASREVRERYREWLARRMDVPLETVQLPEPVGAFGHRCAELAEPDDSARPLFETVEFTTMDFLTYGQEREQEIERRFGADLARLIKIDRRRAIRQAFRSFPLHRFPEAYRTINPLMVYLDYFAGGRIILLPLRLIGWFVRGIILLARQITKTVRDLLSPLAQVDASVDTDTFAIALRKIHRMRKPAVLASIWMRARFDPEYLGIALPGVPITVGSATLFDEDLEFIGSTRRDRLAAEQLVVEQRRLLDPLWPTLARLQTPVADLPAFLAEHYPYLAHRSAEVTRAIAIAWMVNESDLNTLASSIDALRRCIDHLQGTTDAANPLPADLPSPLGRNSRRPWKGQWSSRRRKVEAVLDRVARVPLEPAERERFARHLSNHWTTIRDWVQTIQDIPTEFDPVDVLNARLREIILRTDLWSDQVVVLRTLQTLSLLDVYHYCRVVWNLGGYGDRDQLAFPAVLPSKGEAWRSAQAAS